MANHSSASAALYCIVEGYATCRVVVPAFPFSPVLRITLRACLDTAVPISPTFTWIQYFWGIFLQMS